ncbi:MAG: hypothetical protein QM784_25585 [Polyangiaceae bacterium]
MNSSKSVEEVARDLAAAHRVADPDIKQIFMVRDPAGREVRLLEVSGSVGNSGTVMPFRFSARPDLDVPFPSVVILMSPEEKAQLDQQQLHLPETWGPSPTLVPIE